MKTKSVFRSNLLLCTVIFVVSGLLGSAQAQNSGTRITDGLNGPMGVLVTPDGTVWVVDSGTGGDEVREGIDPATRQPSTIRTGETSRILRIHSGETQEVIALLPSVMTNPTLVFGGARLAMLRGELYVTSGGWSEVNPGERESLHAAVVRITDGERTEVANTWNVELDSNPDGMSRESNPYGLTVGPDSMLWVADAAANTLLKVDPATGALVVVTAFDGIESPLPSPNRGGALECDPVPTAVAFDEEGNAYVSLLSGIPFRTGAAAVVKVTPNGAVEDWATNLTMLTDLRRGPDGQLYAVSFQKVTDQGPVPNSGALVRVHEGSGSEEVLTGLAFPTSVDFNAEGDAFIAINGVGSPGTGEIWRFDKVAGKITTQMEMTMSSSDSLPDMVNKWLSVHQGSFDLDGYLALFAEDVAFRDAETGITAQGRAELAEAVRPFTQLTDLSPRILRHATNEDQVFVEGELNAKTPTGESVVIRGVIIFTVEDSQFTSLTTYLFRQNVSLEGGSD